MSKTDFHKQFQNVGIKSCLSQIINNYFLKQNPNFHKLGYILSATRNLDHILRKTILRKAQKYPCSILNQFQIIG